VVNETHTKSYTGPRLLVREMFTPRQSTVNEVMRGIRRSIPMMLCGLLSNLLWHSICHRIKISNRRATQRCNLSAFLCKNMQFTSQKTEQPASTRVYWPENVIDWLGKWRPTCVMRHARGQKLQSFRRKWPFYMDLYSMVSAFADTKIVQINRQVFACE
jgi:hypothetical protein